MALNVKVGLIGALDMLKFKNLAKTRREAIEALPEKPLPKSFETNEKAEFMHPRYQDVRIKAMRPNGPDAVTVTLCSPDSKALAPFRAGQYLSELRPSSVFSFITDFLKFHASSTRILKNFLSISVSAFLDKSLTLIFELSLIKPLPRVMPSLSFMMTMSPFSYSPKILSISLSKTQAPPALRSLPSFFFSIKTALIYCPFYTS